MSDAEGPQASDPADVGIDESAPMMQVEPARLLANDARGELRARGFEDDQIEEWASAFVAIEGSGDAATFIRWIDEQQGEPPQRG